VTTSNSPPIIVKKVIKKVDGHHGGSWKVAFADFATAMMAFFMLMWIMGSTTEEQKGAISEYFNNPSRTPGASDVPNPNPLIGEGGSSPSLIDLVTAAPTLETPEDTPSDMDESREHADSRSTNEAEQIVEAVERQRLEELLAELKQAVEKSQALKPFKDQLLLDITPEGLRIQIIDKEGRPMFALGSAELKDYTRVILAEISKTVNEVPNRISITGHTDAYPYTQRKDYGNWELSADRANAARRAMVTGGLNQDKIGRVVGFGDSVLFVKEDPFAPVNRRISIIVMNQKTEEAMLENSSGLPTETAQGPVARAIQANEDLVWRSPETPPIRMTRRGGATAPSPGS
jgi:chemotaxis protein MotB